jgi:hypothetical protein
MGRMHVLGESKIRKNLMKNGRLRFSYVRNPTLPLEMEFRTSAARYTQVQIGAKEDTYSARKQSDGGKQAGNGKRPHLFFFPLF